MSDRPTRRVKIKPYGPYTVGQLAKIFEVSPRTISKWGDSGLMKCYRLPLAGDRRFTRESVMKFLEAHPDLPRPAMFVVDAGTI